MGRESQRQVVVGSMEEGRVRIERKDRRRDERLDFVFEKRDRESGVVVEEWLLL